MLVSFVSSLICIYDKRDLCAIRILKSLKWLTKRMKLALCALRIGSNCVSLCFEQNEEYEFCASIENFSLFLVHKWIPYHVNGHWVHRT